jgi:hypothetical protein
VCVFKLEREASDRPRHSNRYWVRCGAPRTCYVSSSQADALNLSVAETPVGTQRDLRQSAICWDPIHFFASGRRHNLLAPRNDPPGALFAAAHLDL